MITLRRICVPLLVLLATAAVARGEFPLKDGDIWVMAGDSITAQHMHSNYFEAFCYARYPKMKFGFRNSGVGGHTIPSTLARFEYDIAAWKPTVVSVELGMNDKGNTDTNQFIANMEKMVERIRGIKARPIIFAASPVNNGETMGKLGGNKRLDEYAGALKEFCAKEKIPFADQFHALVDVWGKNKPNEVFLEKLLMIQKIAKDDKLAGVEHLRAFLKAHESDFAKLVTMQGDAVHPGPTGQLMMAAALLKELGAEPFVSSVTIDAAGTVKDAKGCKVTKAKKLDQFGKITFDRLDECLPFPIPEDGRAALKLYPPILQLSQYTLKVTGLPAADPTSPGYLVIVNNVNLGSVTVKELEAGVNLTRFGLGMPGKSENPIAGQGKAILEAVSARAALVNQWRGLSKAAHSEKAPAELKTQLEALTKKVEAADEAIRAAAQPKTLHFEISPG